MLQDTYREKGFRQKLIDSIKDKGFKDNKVLEAMNNVPRHFFFEASLQELAYRDKAYPIGCEQTISQPFTVAIQTSLLKLSPYEKVLEIGTGSGYQTCILAELKAQVFTIERQKDLFDKITQFAYIKKYKNIKFYYGDGFKGLPQFAPFNKILLTAAIEEIPKELFKQLKIGGRMVLPLNKKGQSIQEMTVVTKRKSEEYDIENFGGFNFVPMLKGVTK